MGLLRTPEWRPAGKVSTISSARGAGRREGRPRPSGGRTLTSSMKDRWCSVPVALQTAMSTDRGRGGSSRAVEAPLAIFFFDPVFAVVFLRTADQTLN